MQHPDKNTPDPIKPDLKHDSMEYSASTEGDDQLDIDDDTELDIEEEEITAEELEYLDSDTTQEQADALNTAETDSLADEDNFLVEPEQELEFDQPDPALDEEES